MYAFADLLQLFLVLEEQDGVDVTIAYMSAMSDREWQALALQRR